MMMCTFLLFRVQIPVTNFDLPHTPLFSSIFPSYLYYFWLARFQDNVYQISPPMCIFLRVLIKSQALIFYSVLQS